MNRALVAGGALVVAGGLVVVGGGVLPPAPYVLVLLLAAGALVLAGGALIDRRLAEGERPSLPDVERGHRVPVPGGTVEEARADGSDREFRQRLTRRVLATLQREGWTRAEAEARVEDGSWTDDPVAAAYLGEVRVRIPLRTRVRWFFDGESATDARARRALDALRARREGGDDG